MQRQDVVPVAMCALVFQNVVPVVAANLAFDPAKVQYRHIGT